MLRRLSITLILALGFLVGMASPVAACAAMAQRDCCPEGSPAPCDGGLPASDPASAAVCCVQPAPAPSVARAANEAKSFTPAPDSGSADPIVSYVWLATLRPEARTACSIAAVPIFNRADAARTYLHTRRLRL
jgi:hypothetical protein